jgi:hypothetical protein
MHYYRKRRTGSYDLNPKQLPERILQSAGYVRLLSPNHPLNDHNGNRAYEHRVVYYNNHGKGPFHCHWCGRPITWADMDIDHLDDNKANNAISNLVASCPRCNKLRGKHKMIAKKSAWITFNGKTLTVRQWSHRIGISRESLHWRIEHGWPLEKALTAPRGKTGPQSRKFNAANVPAGRTLPPEVDFGTIPF